MYILGVLETIRGQRKAFQSPMKLKIASVASAGLTSGKVILKNIPNSDIPSIRAASRRSSGTDSINCRIRKTPNALIIPGNMMPQYESNQPKRLDIMYHGITSISVGIIRVLRMRTKMILFPGNEYLARVKPTNESKNRTEIVVITAMIALFKSQRRNREESKISR